MATIQSRATVYGPSDKDVSPPEQPHERGRKRRSRTDHTSRPSSSKHSPHQDQNQTMGQQISRPRRGSNSKSKSPAKASRSQHQPALAIQLDRDGSICQSPTWSPRGSLAARRQAEKDRREQQRQRRKEADEARRLLKEEEQRQKSLDPIGPRRMGKRLSKQPPPAAMETQRMPAALKMGSSTTEENSKRRRSSSLSSVIRMVTGARSSSKNRSREQDEEAYMSDASVASKSAFIGGVKLQQAKAATLEIPRIDESAIRRSSPDFSTQMQAQMDSITENAAKNGVPRGSAVVPPRGSSQQHVRQSSASLPEAAQASHIESADPESELPASTEQRRSSSQVSSDSHPERRISVRLASINRMQNLVIPLRSAMKGGRETAGKGKYQSMPSWNNSSPPNQPQAALGDYVRRARLRDQSRSMAGWEDEMAVKNANEIAAREAAAAEAATVQSSFGPQMPPTPDASIDTLPRPSKESTDKPRQFVLTEIPPSGTSKVQSNPASPTVPGDAEQFTWKQPIKANKAAAATRVEASLENHKSTERPTASDIDTLPSQQPRRSLAPQALKPPITAATLAKQLPPEPIPELDASASGNRDSPPADLQDHGLRRQPAVMSWKQEKDKNGRVFSSSPRSPTSPPTEHLPPPEQHPSLAALRGESNVIQESRSEGALRVVDPDKPSNEALGSSIMRPFSIVPTPVASPMPGDLISMAGSRSIKTPGPVRRHSTPVETLEESRTGSKADGVSAMVSTFPFPDRHVTLRKPERKDPDAGDSLKQDSDRSDREGASSIPASGKVTFHTPPESPRYLAVSTSYDAYRRPYSKASPGLKGLEIVDDDLELPVPATSLGKPNPPFAQEGKLEGRRGGGRGSRESSTSPRRGAAGRRASDGYVYLPFSPAASSASLPLAGGSAGGKPRGFKLKNPDGTANLDMAAKVFVICCGCNKWHDIPSSLYREMSKGMRQIDPRRDRIAEARPPSHGRDDRSSSREAAGGVGGGGGRDSHRNSRRPHHHGSGRDSRTRSGVLATVPCCWCKHAMSTLCCEGWTTVCFKHSQHHAIERGAGAGAVEPGSGGGGGGVDSGNASGNASGTSTAAAPLAASASASPASAAAQRPSKASKRRGS